MRLVGYAIFGMAILLASVFFLAPDKKEQKPFEAPKATMAVPQKEPTATDIVPKVTEPPEKTVEDNMAKDDKSAEPSAGLAVSQEAIGKAPDHFNQQEQQQENYLSSPGELTFDGSEVPDFPPLPPLEDEEAPVFDELPAAGFPEQDFGEGGFGSNDGFPLESETEGNLGNTEF